MPKGIYRPIFTLIFLLIISVASAQPDGSSPDASSENYVGILFQENVTQGVAGDRNSYKDFIRELPEGTQVMLAYAASSMNRVRQPFTSNRERAAEELRAPGGLSQLAPGSPFQLVKDALENFPANGDGTKALIFISDGIDYNFGLFDTAPTANPMLRSAIREAKERNVKVYTIYAPTQNSQSAATIVGSHGQGSLSVLAEETGGESFFTGDSYVTARPHLKKIHELLRF